MSFQHISLRCPNFLGLDSSRIVQNKNSLATAKDQQAV